MIATGGVAGIDADMQRTIEDSPTGRTGASNREAWPSVYRKGASRKFSAIAISEIEMDELASVVTAPEQVLNDSNAAVIKRGRSALVVRVGLSIGNAEMQTAFKRCGGRTQLRRFIRGVRTSAALRNFVLGHRLRGLGIATPCPLMAIWPRWRNLLSPSYLATEWIDDAQPLDAFARTAATWSSGRRRASLTATARQLGCLIGTLHKHRFSHRDLKSANLLARERSRQVEVFLIDLDGAEHSRFRVETTRMKNLSRLHRATQQLPGATPALRCRFLKTYLATLGWRTDWKTVWRRLQKTSRIPPPPGRRAG